MTDAQHEKDRLRDLKILSELNWSRFRKHCKPEIVQGSPSQRDSEVIK